jgi:hypothetical protein
MGRPKKDDQAFQARGCQIALDMANDVARLTGATREQLGIAGHVPRARPGAVRR